ncbi:MAG TPA: hypothetical protein VKB35_17975 [Ktedonobacteraceae bacterium]|nr:hypothetical protein [Ktedonobacteraceae bacterium]
MDDGAGVDLCAAGDCDVGEFVEHAASRMTINEQQMSQHLGG